MKLQMALDRITLERALELVELAGDFVDVIEVGTSLIKDFGMRAVRELRAYAPGHVLLADVKTMDEGEYEFAAAYRAGADMATVMGAASIDTIAACHRVATDEGKSTVIDLLETSGEKIQQLEKFQDAIFCIHLPKDGKQVRGEGVIRGGIMKKVEDFCENHPAINRIAVAGGVQPEHIRLLRRYPVEVCVVGSAITSASDVRMAAARFQEFLQS